MLKLDGPGIVIRRYPDMDDEPDLTQFEFAATNGASALCVMLYASASCFAEMGSALTAFPRSSSDRWETAFGWQGSAASLTIRAFTAHGGRTCAIGFEAAVEGNDVVRSAVTFAMESEAAALNRLGHLLNQYARLQHIDLFWSTTGGDLFSDERRDLAR